MVTAGIDFYNTVWMGDNCLWAYYSYRTLTYTTNISHKMAKCGYNAKKIMSGHSLSELGQLFLEHPFYEDLGCEYDNIGLNE